MKERVTVSLGERAAARVRQCAARDRAGASGYVERLIRDDELREAAAAMARWYAAHPGYADDALAEQDAALDESA